MAATERGNGEIRGLQKLELPPRNTQWGKVLIAAHAHVLSSIRLFYHQPCLETAEVLQMTNTLKPSHPGIDSTPGEAVLWPLQANQLKCASGESVTQLLQFPHARR